jgi:UDP-N-acetylmuramate: L-alanyl-gamma-D-glutamyl-meso-diaminopimelate ligase
MTKPHQPLFIRKPIPDQIQKIHLIGIAGSGMGAFACMLKQAGYEVRGSDQNIYPPMSDTLADKEIPVMISWQAQHLEWQPDLVIVGNVCRRDNIEAVEAERRGIAYVSFPQALCDLFLFNRSPIVVAGTHGKTTTTSILAWLLYSHDPQRTGMLVGGIGANFNTPFLIGQPGGAFVIEGDEYDTAFFDKGPKFLHYKPDVALLNNVEFDHADIYDDITEIEENFDRLCALMGTGKTLWVNQDDARALRCAQKAQGKIITYGFANEAMWRASDIKVHAQGSSFTLHFDDIQYRVHSPLAGRHNIWNTLVSLGIAHVNYGMSMSNALAALQDFKGVQKRQEEIGDYDGVLVIDDYAHHPTAIYETILALKARYPERRLWAIYEPKSNTARRNIHQTDYADAFAVADVVRLARPFKKKNDFADDEKLDLTHLTQALSKAGIWAKSCADIDTLLAQLVQEVESGDLLVFMSSSSFERAQYRILDLLKAR